MKSTGHNTWSKGHWLADGHSDSFAPVEKKMPIV